MKKLIVELDIKLNMDISLNNFQKKLVTDEDNSNDNDDKQVVTIPLLFYKNKRAKKKSDKSRVNKFPSHFFLSL